ncbi:hypothetical protein N9L92_04020 [Saprospiraceae bacterium]|nr:hypothetical protein [Saprospiraceae bacterium]
MARTPTTTYNKFYPQSQWQGHQRQHTTSSILKVGGKDTNDNLQPVLFSKSVAKTPTTIYSQFLLASSPTSKPISVLPFKWEGDTVWTLLT